MWGKRKEGFLTQQLRNASTKEREVRKTTGGNSVQGSSETGEQECEEFCGNAHASFCSGAGQSVIPLCDFCGSFMSSVVLSCVAVGESGIPVYKAVVPCSAFIMRNGLSFLIRCIWSKRKNGHGMKALIKDFFFFLMKLYTSCVSFSNCFWKLSELCFSVSNKILRELIL